MEKTKHDRLGSFVEQAGFYLLSSFFMAWLVVGHAATIPLLLLALTVLGFSLLIKMEII